MAEFLRPAVTARLRRGRGVVLAVVLIALGLWMALAAFGATAWLGWLVAALGAGLAYA